MRKIESISIVFENCECIVIKGEHLLSFSLKDTQVVYTGGEQYIGVTLQMTICSKTNTEYIPFGVYEKKTYVFDSIQGGRDITILCIKHTDGSESTYRVKWDESNEYKNALQKSNLTANGNLLITIGDKEYINDSN